MESGQNYQNAELQSQSPGQDSWVKKDNVASAR